MGKDDELKSAAENGDAAAVKRLLGEGANVHAKDSVRAARRRALLRQSEMVVGEAVAERCACASRAAAGRGPPSSRVRAHVRAPGAHGRRALDVGTRLLLLLCAAAYRASVFSLDSLPVAICAPWPRCAARAIPARACGGLRVRVAASSRKATPRCIWRV